MNDVTRAALAGGVTLATAAGLQGAYKLTGFYPPKPVFWFAIGFTAHLVINEVQKRRRLPETRLLAYQQRRADFGQRHYLDGMGQHPLHPTHPYRARPAAWGGRSVSY